MTIKLGFQFITKRRYSPNSVLELWDKNFAAPTGIVFVQHRCADPGEVGHVGDTEVF